MSAMQMLLYTICSCILSTRLIVNADVCDSVHLATPSSIVLTYLSRSFDMAVFRLITVSLLANSLLVVARLYLDAPGTNNVDSNSTIKMGYFLQSEQRIAAIGIAIDQAQSDGLLRGYDFRLDIQPYHLTCESHISFSAGSVHTDKH